MPLIPRCHRGLRSGYNRRYIAIIRHYRVSGRRGRRRWHSRATTRRYIATLRGSCLNRGLPGRAGRPSGGFLRRISLGTNWHSRATARRASSGVGRAHRERGLPCRAIAHSASSVLRRSHCDRNLPGSPGRPSGISQGR